MSDKAPILTIRVKTEEAFGVEGRLARVTMIPFTCVSDGPYFFGRSLGTGTDTQINKDGIFSLSARYMLAGRDYTGAECRLFIENKGSFEDGFIPFIVTDSKALSEWEYAKLYSEIEPAESGVTVRIFLSSCK